MATLGEVLSEARELRGLSLREVERATGIHNAHISQIEKGRIDRPDVGLLWELARLYELDLVVLMELAGHIAAGSVSGEPSARSMASAALRAVGTLPPPEQAKALGFLQRLGLRRNQPVPSLSEQMQHRIAAIAERALVWADAADRLPTPLEDVANASGVLGFEPVSNLPADAESGKPSHWKKILGAIVFPTRTIYVDEDLVGGRENFTKAHETAHVLLPWHETAYLLDDERNLFFGTREELEAEANLAAAHLIFQGHRYHDQAADQETSIRVPITLAKSYGASIHASIRYYIEHHHEPVAGLVAGRYPQHDGSLPVWISFESREFAAQFGRLSDFLPPEGLPLEQEGFVLGELAKLAFNAVDPPSDTVLLPALDGNLRRFVAEAFFNQYTMFIMVSPKRRVPRGRRSRLAHRSEAK